MFHVKHYGRQLNVFSAFYEPIQFPHHLCTSITMFHVKHITFNKVWFHVKHSTHDLMNSFLAPYDISDSSSKIEKLLELKELYGKWNKKHNLFSKGDWERFDERHLLDSLQPIQFLKKESPKQWLDIGSGTGFPSLPLAIVLDDFSFVGIEPREKRVSILNQFRRTLGLENIKFYAETAEAHPLKQHYSYISARAVGSLAEDWERAKPLLQKKGQFITFKTRKETLDDTKNTEFIEYSLNTSTNQYYIVSVKEE